MFNSAFHIFIGKNLYLMQTIRIIYVKMNVLELSKTTPLYVTDVDYKIF